MADYDDIIQDDQVIEDTPERKALETVKRDFTEAQEYLKKFHQQGVDRYEHYIAPGKETNTAKDKSFPVPFTTEQVDTLTADMIEKLFYKDEPCSMHGRNDQDKADADVKRQFFSYQDEVDEIEDKMRQAIINAAIYKIAPAVINYKEETKTITEMRPTALRDETGQVVFGIDGQTPVMIDVPTPVNIYTYQGASVELVDPIDFFWTKEKRALYDEFPLIVRSRCTLEWFKSKPYINQDKIPELKAMGRNAEDFDDDLLDTRRNILDYGTNQPSTKQYNYVEWQGYIDLGEGRDLYIIGVVENKFVMRIQKAKDIFDLGHPNIVVGIIGRQFGEVYGLSLVDKFHSVQHGLDSMMGIFFKNLRQTGNNMWAGNSTKMKTKKFENDAGVFIDCLDDPDKVLKRMDQQQISQDVYAGMEMFRKMGQNSSGIQDIAEGVVQEGVETLGEANIIAGQSAIRSKGGYLRCFEASFVKPSYKIRNHVNMKFCTDPGYLFAVLEEGIMNWKQISPQQIRTEVDFICEASNRENQRAIVTQQVLQALNLTIKMAEILGPIPLVKLLEKLYEEGFGWKRDTIEELLPLEAIQAQIMMNEMEKQQQMVGESMKSMPQPVTEGQAKKSAEKKNETQVGRM